MEGKGTNTLYLFRIFTSLSYHITFHVSPTLMFDIDINITVFLTFYTGMFSATCKD